MVETNVHTDAAQAQQERGVIRRADDFDMDDEPATDPLAGIATAATGQALLDWLWPGGSNPAGTLYTFDMDVADVSLTVGDFQSDDDSPLTLVAYDGRGSVVASDSESWPETAGPSFVTLSVEPTDVERHADVRRHEDRRPLHLGRGEPDDGVRSRHLRANRGNLAALGTATSTREAKSRSIRDAIERRTSNARGRGVSNILFAD